MLILIQIHFQFWCYGVFTSTKCNAACTDISMSYVTVSDVTLWMAVTAVKVTLWRVTVVHELSSVIVWVLMGSLF